MLWLGRAAEARELVLHALEDSRRYGYRLVEGHAWTVLARLELGCGRLTEAQRAAEKALAVRQETGHQLADADPGPVLEQLARLRQS